MTNSLTLGEKIARDLCEMDAPVNNCVEVDPVDVARRIDEVCDELKRQRNEKQAVIDSLMLEYCPYEMLPEQIAEWAGNQKPVPE